MTSASAADDRTLFVKPLRGACDQASAVFCPRTKEGGCEGHSADIAGASPFVKLEIAPKSAPMFAGFGVRAMDRRVDDGLISTITLANKHHRLVDHADRCVLKQAQPVIAAAIGMIGKPAALTDPDRHASFDGDLADMKKVGGADERRMAPTGCVRAAEHFEGAKVRTRTTSIWANSRATHQLPPGWHL